MTSGSRDAQVLQALRGLGVHLLPGDLAAQLRMPLAEVESTVASLRGAGFDIESKPGLGLRLGGNPDRILADDLWSRLSPGSLLREILVFEETGSTNDVALRLGREGHPGGLAIFAERQTAGRGRFGRRWDSADHEGLWFSLLLRPDWPVAQWPRLTTWAGVAVTRALESFLKVRVQLKWPNDAQIHGRKIAGILIESAADCRGQQFAVAGIGVNVNQAAFPRELEGMAISARQAAGVKCDRPALAAAILGELSALWEATQKDFSQILEDASARSSLLGAWVQLHCGGEIIEGMAEALDPAGQLLVRMPGGTLRAMAAGEVSSQSVPVDITGM